MPCTLPSPPTRHIAAVVKVSDAHARTVKINTDRRKKLEGSRWYRYHLECNWAPSQTDTSLLYCLLIKRLKGRHESRRLVCHSRCFCCHTSHLAVLFCFFLMSCATTQCTITQAGEGAAVWMHPSEEYEVCVCACVCVSSVSMPCKMWTEPWAPSASRKSACKGRAAPEACCQHILSN